MIAAELHRKLMDKVSSLPFAKDKEIEIVLFLKNKPKYSEESINIMYPQDIINAMHGG